MPIRLAVVGPGRVGQALGRRWAEAGVHLLGFVGRDRDRVAAALTFAGHASAQSMRAQPVRALSLRDLVAAHVVVFAVGDPDLPGAIAAAAEACPARRCSLWLHTSGRHGLEVLAPLAAASVRLGALHPAVPFPDAATGFGQLAGRPAVLLGEPRARRLLVRLCTLLGMVPLWAQGAADRTLYHAACALAANGLTALRGAVDEVLARAGALVDPAAAGVLADALMTAALQACRERGARAALSGPVARGDAATVAAHRRALRASGADLDEVYRALMLQALRLQAGRLPESAAAALRSALGAAMD